MTIDLTKYVNQALNKAEYWSTKKFRLTVEALRKTIHGTTFDWDFQDLEYWSDFTGLQIKWALINIDERTWGKIEKEKKTIAYIRVDIPLMIILDTYAEKIQNEDFFKNLEIIYSPDFFLKAYTIEQNTLENLFVKKNKSIDFFISFIKNFNLEAFSIKEFWWFSIIPPPEKYVKCDLTNLFIESNCNKHALTSDELLLTTKKIINFIPESTLNYEEEESWATITTLEKTVCIIGVNVAVIFVLNEYVDIIQKAVDLNPVLIIPVDSYETQEYKVDIPLMKKEFPFWHLEYLPPVFSIYDLIF